MTDVERRERRERIAAQMVAAILANPEYSIVSTEDKVAAGVEIANLLIKELDWMDDDE